MSERYIGVVDIGASEMKAMIFDTDGYQHFSVSGPTYPDNYERSIQQAANFLEAGVRHRRGELVVASGAVAATLDKDGVLVQSGRLHPWLGKQPANDLALALNLPSEQAAMENDVVVIATSEQWVNAMNGNPLDGMGATLSTGVNLARYYAVEDPEEEKVEGMEEGHEHLRTGAKCPCGGEGHVEAHISGAGVQINHGISMQDWLRDPQNERQLTEDISFASVNLLNRHRERDGFTPVEIRWTGGVALGQPIIMQRAARMIREQMGSVAPVFEPATYLDRAGLHGTLIRGARMLKTA